MKTTTTVSIRYYLCCRSNLLATLVLLLLLSFTQLPTVVVVGFSLTSWTSSLLPRLPDYHFRVTSVPRVWWKSGHVQVPSSVSLYNDNIFPIDVHAMSFDLYYPTWHSSKSSSSSGDHHTTADDGNTSLIHLGHVLDQQQHQQEMLVLQKQNTTPCYYHHGGMLKCDDDDDDDDNNDEVEYLLLGGANNAKMTSSTSTTSGIPQAPPPSVIWSVPARASFATTDDIFLAPSTISSWTTLFYHGVCQILWNVLYHGQHTLYIPSTGVLYVKAKVLSTKVPLTIRMVCDNALQLWTMELRGIECVMHTMDVGWWPLQTHVSELQSLALYEWMPTIVNRTIPPLPPSSTSSTSTTSKTRHWNSTVLGIPRGGGANVSSSSSSSSRPKVCRTTSIVPRKRRKRPLAKPTVVMG